MLYEVITRLFIQYGVDRLEALWRQAGLGRVCHYQPNQGLVGEGHADPAADLRQGERAQIIEGPAQGNLV